MSFENPKFESGKESEPKAKAEIEVRYGSFVPQEFPKDPIGYFENKGRGIKLGEIKRDAIQDFGPSALSSRATIWSTKK